MLLRLGEVIEGGHGLSGHAVSIGPRAASQKPSKRNKKGTGTLARPVLATEPLYGSEPVPFLFGFAKPSQTYDRGRTSRIRTVGRDWSIVTGSVVSWTPTLPASSRTSSRK